MKKMDFNLKNILIELAGTCFWYWATFYSFLESCGIPSSVYKQYGRENKYQVMRCILEQLERQQKNDLIKNIIKQFYDLTRLEDQVNKEKAKKLLQELRSAVGDTLLEDEIKQKEVERKKAQQRKVVEERQTHRNKILGFKDKFLMLHDSEKKQQRGYEIERLFFDLLEAEEFEFKRPYKITGEQIDGYFKYEKFDYLVEIKWEEEQSGQNELSIFDGKIRGKAQSTRGLILSISGFDQNVITKFSGDAPRIILMDGRDVMSIMEERTTFFDLMKLKTDSLVRKGNIYVNY